MPTKSFMDRYAAANPEDDDAPAQRRATSRVKMDSIGAGLLGVADTITFGYLDEIGAGLDSLVSGGSYEENLQRNRDILGQASEEHGGAYLTGQIAGGFVPIFGWGGRTVKGATLAGAGFGALYGTGSSDGGLEDRLRSGAIYGTAGAIGGYLVSGVVVPAAKWAGGRLVAAFGRGKPVRLDGIELRASEQNSGLGESAREAAQPPLSARPAEPASRTPSPPSEAALAAKASPVPAVERDAVLLTSRELLGEPKAAAGAVAARIGKMTPEAAERVLREIQAAETDGTVAANPHFRSLLNLDLSETDLAPEKIARAAAVFEDAIETLADKAGQAPRTVRGMDQQVTNELRKGLTLTELEDVYQRSQNGFVDTRIAQHVMLTAAAKVVRLREELLPALLKGEDGVRDRVAKELTEAAHRMVFAKGILSNAGRALGILSHGTRAHMLDVAEDAQGLSVAEIRQRVDASLAKLGDHNLVELLARVRTLGDAENIERVLLSEAEAEAFTAWQRTLGSVSLWLRSNALTPATFIFNVASLIGHAALRGMASRRVAAAALEKAHKLDEATALRLEESIVRSVRWDAMKVGTQAMLKRVQWEFWSDVERIASVGWGSGKVAAKARLNRGTLLSEGYSPPTMREFDEKPRLNVRDTDAFNVRNDARLGGGALANLLYHFDKARAVAANTLDALGGAGMKLFTAMPDDMGREYVRITHGFALSAREAFREARELQVPADQLADYVSTRARELATMPTAEMLEKVEAALLSGDGLQGEASFLARLHSRIEQEADEALFMDGPQTAGGKLSSRFLHWADRLGIVLPYVDTPLRLFERGLVNYGPFAGQSREVRAILEKGGPEAALEKARVEIGMRVFNFGIVAGLTGAITASNGGSDNSANLDAGPPNRLNLPGGGFIEISRLDPFSLTVGLGAIFGQALRDGYQAGTEYDQSEALAAIASTAYFGARSTILDKSYLKGLQDLLDVAPSDEEPGRWSADVERVLQNAAARMVPLGGVSRQVNETFRSSAVESVGWADTLLRSIPGGGYGMAPKIDPLGDEVKSRTLGINFGNSEVSGDEPISGVKRRLRELGIDLTTIRKSDPDGFNLSSDELAEVRRIRAKEALNDDGLTMHEALEELFDDPWFRSLPSKDAKRTAVIDLMRSFNKPAWELLQERDAGFASKRKYTRSLADYIAEGLTRRQADSAAREDLEAEGLPAPEL